MLNQLSIRNVAVIDALDVSLKDGMSVLTGETGAGKSIIIDSINMILGERTNKELVRYGTKSAGVQAVFDANGIAVSYLDANGIEVEENQIIITRQINNDGKSIAKINGNIVTLAQLREVADLLINIHGQHDNQALLTPKKHIRFLDDFADVKTEYEDYARLYSKVKELKKKIASLGMDEQEKLRRIDLLTYQTDEIESAKLRIGEEEELKEQLEICENAEKITTKIGEAYKNAYDGDEMPSAYDSISVAVKAMEAVKDYDEKLSKVYESLSEAMYSIEDCAQEISRFAERIDYDEAVLNELEERLDLISKLKRKYGSTIEEIIEYGKKASAELNEIVSGDELLEKLKAEIDKEETLLRTAGKKLSQKRKIAAQELGDKIERALFELNMEKSQFVVKVEETDEFYDNGMNYVEFMISTNPGEPLKPLVKIASGGELSRVMLAIKSIIAESDSVDTLIFDEIDTGVSGNTALKIAQKLKQIAKTKQVICITHLPQLTSISDNHYLIEKNTDGELASTRLKRLDDEGRVMELARLIDGGEVTEIAYNHAKELLRKG